MNAGPERMGAIYDPQMHEQLEALPWDASRARAARDAIVAGALEAITEAGLWPAHPDDFGPDDDRDNPPTSVYLGAAGVIAALAAIVPQNISLRTLAARAALASQISPNQRELGLGSYMLGSAGPALSAALYADDKNAADRLMFDAGAMVANDGYEIFAGAPGFMIASKAMFDFSGDESWSAVWLEMFRALSAAWEEAAPQTFLWHHNVYGRGRRRYLGAGHGFAGTAGVLLAGLNFVSDEDAATIVGRIVETAAREREKFGVPWYSLWTGDLGVALFAHACLGPTPAIPSIDGWPARAD